MVREISIYEFLTNHRDKNLEPVPENERHLSKEEHTKMLALKEAVKAKQQFEHLKSLGVRTSLDIVIGKNNHGSSEAVYLVTDDIDGEKLLNVIPSDKKEKGQKRIKAELLQLLNALATYVESVVASSNARILWDVSHTEQYMWGKKKGDDAPHIYLVDVEPYVIEPAHETNFRIRFLNDLLYFVQYTSSQFGLDTQKIVKKVQKMQDDLRKS